MPAADDSIWVLFKPAWSAENADGSYHSDIGHVGHRALSLAECAALGLPVQA